MTMEATATHIRPADFPEEIGEKDGVRTYGEAGRENQLAVLSHFLESVKNLVAA